VLRKNAKVALISRVPLFSNCSKRELAELASLADEVSVPAGKKLTSQGALGHEFVVIVEGAADVRRSGRVVNRLRAGDFLGEVALLTGQKRTATVTTTEPSRVLVLTARDFRMLLRDLPSLQLKVLDAVATRLPAE
jgi:CRP-like cAMP-binding protein